MPARRAHGSTSISSWRPSASASCGVFQHFTTARAYIALGRAEEAEALLRDLVEFGRGFNRPLDVGEAGALSASLLWARGRKDEAVDALAEALEALAPYGFFRVVADEGASWSRC